MRQPAPQRGSRSALPGALDQDGRDPLKVFLRSDAEIAQEVRQDVLVRAMWVNPDTVTVEVRDGVVTLTGQLERRSLVPITVSLVHGVDGVVDVVDRLTFEVDDGPIMVPSDLADESRPQESLPAPRPAASAESRCRRGPSCCPTPRWRAWNG